jgi:hypothetical protein
LLKLYSLQYIFATKRSRDNVSQFLHRVVYRDIRIGRCRQALETELIAELLSLLETRLDSQAAAQLVGALKAMARSPAHGERVRAALSRSRVWDQYAAQRHDLFISAGPNMHSLTSTHIYIATNPRFVWCPGRNKTNAHLYFFLHYQPINVPTAGAQDFLMDYPQGERAVTHHAGLLCIGGC